MVYDIMRVRASRVYGMKGKAMRVYGIMSRMATSVYDIIRGGP